MPLFEDRERAEEARYARREELTFRIKGDAASCWHSGLQEK
jgi:hypothetical protein